MDLANYWFQKTGPDIYPIGNSLRFRGAQYLRRTPTVRGNDVVWTWSAWIKNTNVEGLQNTFYSAGRVFPSPYNHINFQGPNGSANRS